MSVINLPFQRQLVIALMAVCAASAMAQGQPGIPSGAGAAVADLPKGWLVSPSEAQAFQGAQGFDEEPALRS